MPKKESLAITLPFFTDLTYSYEVDQRDRSNLLFALNHIHGDPLLNHPSFITIVYDSLGLEAIVPEQISIKRGVSSRDYGSFKAIRFSHTDRTRSLWQKDIMDKKRLSPRATSWDEETAEWGSVWNIIENPSQYAIADPNKASTDKSRKLMIPSISLPPPGIIELSPGCPKIEGYVICYLTHEGEAHLADMRDLPWIWDSDTKQFTAGKLTGNLDEFERLLSKIFGKQESDIHAYHHRNPEYPLFQRDYLGELLVYIADVFRAKQCEKIVSGFSFENYSRDTFTKAFSLHRERNIKRFPAAHKNL